MHHRDALRHWHGHSEPFTGGDSLATAMRNGWEIHQVVVEARRVRGNRSVTICHFTLSRDGEIVVMSVLANPFVFRLIADVDVPVVTRGG